MESKLIKENNMKNSNLTKNVSRYFVICIILLISPLIIYICNFCHYECGNPSDWGSFGCFYGGILNPVITVVVIMISFISLKANEKDNLNKERKEVYEKLFNYSILMQSVVNDLLVASALTSHDTGHNKANYQNNDYDKEEYIIKRNIKSYYGNILGKVSETRYYVEYFSQNKISVFKTFSYENSKCNDLKNELQQIETFLKNGLYGDFKDFRDINNSLNNNITIYFSVFLSEIEDYMDKNNK
jgi:uncharacterized membrane protein